jgi:capsular exopolysaccharide synthesis family protein
MINFSELLWKPQRFSRRAQGMGEAVAEAPRPESTGVEDAPSIEATIGPSCRIALAQDGSGIEADRFRYLRLKLNEVRELAPLRTLLISSPLPEDGKSTIVLNLATALAEGGQRSVLVVEADLHRPALLDRLGVKASALQSGMGLAGCLQGEEDPISAIRKVDPLGWYILPAGSSSGLGTELIQSKSFTRVIEPLARHFDWVLIDSPPILPLTDAIAISKSADATLLVVRAHQTPQSAVKEALNLIGKKHVLGVLFNAADSNLSHYGNYGKYYAKK